MREERASLQALLDQRLAGRDHLRVLDAGCGTALHVELGRDPWVVGIDIDRESLDENEFLNERIVGDLQVYELDHESFDVVVCWDVLEHLARPTLALENMAHSLRSDGLLVIAGPNVMSFKGLATKFTPLRLHRLAYRRLGASDAQPFPTFMRFSTAPQRIAAWALTSSHDLVVNHLGFFEAPMQVVLRERLRLTGRAWTRLRMLTRWATGGKLDPAVTDFFLVLRRSAAVDVAGRPGSRAHPTNCCHSQA